MKKNNKVTEVVNLKDLSYGMKVEDCWAQITYLNIQEIIERFSEHLTEEQIETLKNHGV